MQNLSLKFTLESPRLDDKFVKTLIVTKKSSNVVNCLPFNGCTINSVFY